MIQNLYVAVFGEVLFDCFEGGPRVPGGAPFNVAWHLKALGHDPLFISRIGHDDDGRVIRGIMEQWGMTWLGLQSDPEHATGEVTVSVREGEPHYHIHADRAYDFIDVALLPRLPLQTLLYHGTLAMRSPLSRQALNALLVAAPDCVFVDINLREPWWSRDVVMEALHTARWGKLNLNEMRQIGYQGGDTEQLIERMRGDFDLDQLIVTCGSDGAYLCCRDSGMHFEPAAPQSHVIDTVGAGDAFSAMAIHGLCSGLPAAEILHTAQRFAAAIVGQRGALVHERSFYRGYR